MYENELSYKIIGVAIKLHATLGPGLLESVYESALAHDLDEAGLEIKRQLPISFVYKGIRMESAYRIDLLVNNRVLIELKSIDAIASVHHAQTLTYLKLASKKLGLLINFNSMPLKNGIHRIVNNL
jgi:GxxExxY protein